MRASEQHEVGVLGMRPFEFRSHRKEKKIGGGAFLWGTIKYG